MNDFITMTCPSCGGRLAVSSHAERLVCEHCGNEHLVRRDNTGTSLEAYARCPRCRRNDKSRKVTSVVASQTQEIPGFGPTHASVLGRRLAPPPEPKIQPAPPPQVLRPVGCSTLTAAAALVILGLAGLGSCVANGAADDGGAILILVGFGLGFVLTFVAYFLKSHDRKAQAQREVEHQHRYAEYLEEEKKRQEVASRPWQEAMRRWALLYYCERDDCVFVPGYERSVPASEMTNLLYS